MYNNVKNKNIQNVDSNINNESESDNSVKDNISEEKITSSSNLQDEYLEDGQEDDELETIKKAVNEQLKDLLRRKPTDEELTKYAQNILFLEKNGITSVEPSIDQSDASKEKYLKGKKEEFEEAKKR
ncbi:MAG: hypothetical protein IKJ43_00815 [Bacilli bacterium]|nr:hypothetical protein [Bacilli bacterium]